MRTAATRTRLPSGRSSSPSGEVKRPHEESGADERSGLMATRDGSALWHGDLATGSGRVTVGEGAWTDGRLLLRIPLRGRGGDATPRS
jgi:hypothetical protein